MVKVLYLPLNGSIIQTGMYDAFEQNEVELTIFDFYQGNKVNKRKIRQQFLNKVKEVRPDLIHMQLQFTSVIDSGTLLKAKSICPSAIITNWTGDIRKNVPGEFIEASRGVDISLISSVGQLGLYKSKLYNKDVRYWQIGYNPKLYFPKNKNNFKYDISFVAAKYNNSLFPDAKLRTDIVNSIRAKSNIRFGLYGAKWGRGTKQIHQSKVNDIYADSFAVLSVNNFNDEYLYFSDRLLMCLASGRPVISWRFPGWENYFTDMKNIVIANSIEEVHQKLDYLKKNPALANQIGKAGAEIALREHSYFNRAAELLRMVGLQ